MAKKPAKPRSISVSVSEEFRPVLERLCARTGAKSNADAVDHLLGVYRDMLEDLDRDGRIITQDRSGAATEHSL